MLRQCKSYFTIKRVFYASTQLLQHHTCPKDPCPPEPVSNVNNPLCIRQYDSAIRTPFQFSAIPVFVRPSLQSPPALRKSKISSNNFPFTVKLEKHAAYGSYSSNSLISRSLSVIFASPLFIPFKRQSCWSYN